MKKYKILFRLRKNCPILFYEVKKAVDYLI